MTDIIIPPEVVEAAARAIAEIDCSMELFPVCSKFSGCQCREEARAAITAAISAWPDVTYLTTVPLHSLILPLPAKETDA